MSTTVTDGDGGPEMAKRRRRQFHNPAEPPPQQIVDYGALSLKREFARRLQRLMTERGWNQSELARQASYYMPGKKKFRRDNVSNYIRAEQIPGPVRMLALCKTLKVKPEDLIPPGAVQTVDDATPPLEMTSQGQGRVYLRVNQVVSQEIAMQIIALLGTERTKAQ